MNDLTPKQKAFAEAYIETGNASEAARRAGYSKKTAYSIGDENLRKPDIRSYIDRRMAEIDAARIASADEVLRFYTSVLRGEVQDQFGLEASLDTRLKAGGELMKRFAAGGREYGKNRREDDPLTASLREEAKRLEGVKYGDQQ